MFRSTLTANDKYSFRDLDNFFFSTQIQICLKRKKFSDFFNPHLQSTSNFKHYEKKFMVVATLLRTLQAVKSLVRFITKKHCFGTPFDSEHVKGSKTLVKSA